MIEPAIERSAQAVGAKRKHPVEAMPVYNATAPTKGDRRAVSPLNDQIFTIYTPRQDKLLLTR